MQFKRIKYDEAGNARYLLLMIYLLFQFSFIALNYYENRYTDISIQMQYIQYLLPLVEILIFSLYYKGIGDPLKSLLSPIWFVVLVSVAIVWVFIFNSYHSVYSIYAPNTDTLYMLQILYFPCFVELFNFSSIGVGIGKLFMKKGTAIIVSAIFYSLYYYMYLINAYSGYPYPYDLYFMLDAFSIGIIYIGLYVLTYSIYPAMTLQMSLILLGLFSPPFPPSFFYTLVPS